MPEVKRSKGKPVSKDRRRERGEASVQRIIDATIDLIAEEGLASVTMQRIATHVNSSNALVVFHFRSKENLFRAVLQYLSEQYDALWATMVRSPGLSAVQRLIGAVECAQQFGRQHPKWVSVFVVFASDRKSMQLYHEISLPGDLAYNAESHNLIAEIARDGGYDAVDPDTLSQGLNYLIHGAWFWDHLNPPDGRSEVLRKTVLMVLHQAFPRHFNVLEESSALK
jgi:AcrR family transcriptional regulator